MIGLRCSPCVPVLFPRSWNLFLVPRVAGTLPRVHSPSRPHRLPPGSYLSNHWASGSFLHEWTNPVSLIIIQQRTPSPDNPAALARWLLANPSFTKPSGRFSPRASSHSLFSPWIAAWAVPTPKHLFWELPQLTTVPIWKGLDAPTTTGVAPKMPVSPLSPGGLQWIKESLDSFKGTPS